MYDLKEKDGQILVSSRERLLESIKPGMKLNKAFFLKIYGYEITTPGFAKQALDKLKEIGCRKAYTYYNQFVYEYEEEYQQTMKEAAQWYHNRKDDVKLKKNDNKGVAPVGRKDTRGKTFFPDELFPQNW